MYQHQKTDKSSETKPLGTKEQPYAGQSLVPARELEKIRPYEHEVIDRVRALADRYFIEQLGTVSYGIDQYPFFRIKNFTELDLRKKTVLFTGGVHGDEPAGTYALLEFLCNGAPNDIQFVIYPCVNPSGFESNVAETRDGANLNRLFGTADAPNEIKLLQDDLARLSLKFHIAMDLHEVSPYWEGEGFTKADNPQSCWIYETQRDAKLRIGRLIIDTLPTDIEVCDWPRLYGDKNDRGVIAYLPETTQNLVYAQCTTLDGYVFDRYTEHSFTTETPTGWDIEKRVRVQLHYLKAAYTAIS